MVNKGFEAGIVASAEVKHFVEGRVWGETFWGCLGLGGVDESFESAGVAGALDPGDCDGRHEGRSQHKTVSSRSLDSGAEHPPKNQNANISPERDEKRESIVWNFLMACSSQTF